MCYPRPCILANYYNLQISVLSSTIFHMIVCKTLMMPPKIEYLSLPNVLHGSFKSSLLHKPIIYIHRKSGNFCHGFSLAPKYEVPKLNTPKYVTLQKLTAKIEHCLNIFLYLYSLVCTFLSCFFPK